MFTKMAHEAFMKLKQVRRRSWGGGLPYMHIYIYIVMHEEFLRARRFLSGAASTRQI